MLCLACVGFRHVMGFRYILGLGMSWGLGIFPGAWRAVLVSTALVLFRAVWVLCNNTHRLQLHTQEEWGGHIAASAPNSVDCTQTNTVDCSCSSVPCDSHLRSLNMLLLRSSASNIAAHSRSSASANDVPALKEPA